MRSDNPGFVPDSPFSKQLPEEWLNFFKTFPKLDNELILIHKLWKHSVVYLTRLKSKKEGPYAF